MHSNILPLVLPLLFGCLPAPIHAAPTTAKQAALYFLNNDPAGSQIVSLALGADGVPKNPIKTATGGLGSIGVNSTGQQVGQDSLFTQGSVKVYGNLLFTVNAGSDTLSLFKIDPNNPQHPALVGKPVATGGDFPISVDFSQKLNRACVLNGGKNAGVTCFHVDAARGLEPLAPIRPLGSAILNQTTPANGPAGTATEILFNPDSSAVFVTIKGIPKVHNGSVLVYPVEKSGAVARTPVISHFSDVALPFGFQFLSQDQIYLSDPSFGVALLKVNKDWTLSETAHTVVTGQKAICWTAADSATKTLYGLDAGTNNLYTFDQTTLAQTGAVQLTEPNGKMGTFDAAVGTNGLLYALTGADGIVVVDTKKKSQASFVDLTSVGPRLGFTGIALWNC